MMKHPKFLVVLAIILIAVAAFGLVTAGAQEAETFVCPGGMMGGQQPQACPMHNMMQGMGGMMGMMHNGMMQGQMMPGFGRQDMNHHHNPCVGFMRGLLDDYL